MIAYSTANGWPAIPHVSYTYEPDVTGLMEVYESMRDDFFAEHGHRLTVKILMLKILAEGIKLAPRMNASIDMPRDIDPTNYDGTFTPHEAIDVAAPWHLPSGATLSLTVRDCGGKSLAELAATADELQSKAEATDFDSLYPRSVMPICITFDHRAMGFYDVVPFVDRLEEIFAAPEVIRSW